MVFTHREKNIGITVAVLIGALVPYQYVIEPFWKRRAEIVREIADVTEKRQDADTLFRREKKLNAVWTEIAAGGLKAEEADAKNQALEKVQAWMQETGVGVLNLGKPERPTQEGSFQVINFHVTGTGRMRSIARLMWSLETAQIPLRVNDVKLKPRKEGTDDLQVELSLSTLYLPPDADKPDKKGSIARMDLWGDR